MPMWGSEMYEKPSAQFCYELKSTLENKVYLKKKWDKNKNNIDCHSGMLRRLQ